MILVESTNRNTGESTAMWAVIKLDACTCERLEIIAIVATLLEARAIRQQLEVDAIGKGITYVIEYDVTTL